jgi:hypothetical protein
LSMSSFLAASFTAVKNLWGTRALNNFNSFGLYYS